MKTVIVTRGLGAALGLALLEWYCQLQEERLQVQVLEESPAPEELPADADFYLALGGRHEVRIRPARDAQYWLDPSATLETGPSGRGRCKADWHRQGPRRGCAGLFWWHLGRRLLKLAFPGQGDWAREELARELLEHYIVPEDQALPLANSNLEPLAGILLGEVHRFTDWTPERAGLKARSRAASWAG